LKSGAGMLFCFENRSLRMRQFSKRAWTELKRSSDVNGSKVKRRARSLRSFRRHALAVYPFCQWCHCRLSAETATTDHLVPRSRGGTDQWENLCLACGQCNQKRKNDMPHELPSGPRWAKPASASVLPRQMVRTWVAWTRYQAGRWRPTFRDFDRAACLAAVRKFFGEAVETVLLPADIEPEGPMARSTGYFPI
jgi:5-methylcytosine-specific restriction endonuclease McrA